MALNTLNLLTVAALAMPVMLLLTQRARIAASPQRVGLAACYGLFVVDEMVALLVGVPYRFLHVLLGGLVLSAAATLLCLVELEAGEHRPRLTSSHAILLLGMSVILALLGTQHLSASGAAVLLVVLFVALNGIVLIRVIDDRSIPYLGILVVWAAHHATAWQQFRFLDGVVALLFIGATSLLIGLRVYALNRELLREKEFLTRERDVVVNMLFDVSSSEQSISNIDYTLVRVLEAIIEALQVEGAAVYTRELKGEQIRLRFSHSSGVFWTMQAHSEQAAGKTSFITKDLQRESYRLGEGVVGTVAQTLQPKELDRGHDRNEMRSLGLNPHNIRNALAVPLNVKERVLGVLVVQNRRNATSFGADDTRLMKALAEQAAISINNVHMYEELARSDRIRQEMNIATEIQRTLLPKTVPAATRLQLHPFIRPAKEVGGDYYDFIENAPGSFAIVIGDVSGKGLPAGMIMVIARTTLQIVARGCLDAREALTRFSREMYPRMRRGQFMTLNFLLWDDATGVLRYSAAGHEHILWYRRERGHSERIKAGGVAVGLLEDPSRFLTESSLQSGPGDAFVLYTDGITEARNKAEEMYTLRRLQESLDRHAPLADAEEISAALIADVTAFTADAEQYDDMTLIVAVVRQA